MAIDTPSGVQLRIRGKVQGVGFRPFVWQLAQQLRLHGDVCNDGDGVVVRLLEEPSQFIAALYQDCPPLARIDSVEHASLVWERAPTDFTIRQSAGGSMNTQIVPDAATLPGMSCRDEYPRRAALPLSFHQLHPLWTTLHHYSCYAL
ncbi:hydrogenase maturation protein [Salmonella enterica subsp. enterica]|uniref:acylphosphatase n=1 Tax=Salmonella enterica I TaxID=59201 RepID=A0A447TWW1_SALET|nr:hydrogenase maturation protein [Salmonella enterica subsp. enterica]